MTIRMQEDDFLRDPVQVMAYVRAGDEVHLERDGVCMATIAPPHRREPRHVDEVLQRLRVRALERGPAEMDEDYGADVQVAHERMNQPVDRSQWD